MWASKMVTVRCPKCGQKVGLGSEVKPDGARGPVLVEVHVRAREDDPTQATRCQGSLTAATQSIMPGPGRD